MLHDCLRVGGEEPGANLPDQVGKSQWSCHAMHQDNFGISSEITRFLKLTKIPVGV